MHCGIRLNEKIYCITFLILFTIISVVLDNKYDNICTVMYFLLTVMNFAQQSKELKHYNIN